MNITSLSFLLGGGQRVEKGETKFLSTYATKLELTATVREQCSYVHDVINMKTLPRQGLKPAWDVIRSALANGVFTDRAEFAKHVMAVGAYNSAHKIYAEILSYMNVSQLHYLFRFLSVNDVLSQADKDICMKNMKKLGNNIFLLLSLLV